MTVSFQKATLRRSRKLPNSRDEISFGTARMSCLLNAHWGEVGSECTMETSLPEVRRDRFLLQHMEDGG